MSFSVLMHRKHYIGRQCLCVSLHIRRMMMMMCTHTHIYIINTSKRFVVWLFDVVFSIPTPEFHRWACSSTQQWVSAIDCLYFFIFLFLYAHINSASFFFHHMCVHLHMHPSAWVCICVRCDYLSFSLLFFFSSLTP